MPFIPTKLGTTFYPTVNKILPYRIYAGGSFSCVTMTDWSLYCWGDNTYGQVKKEQTHEPTLFFIYVWYSDITDLQSVSLGSNHGCAIRIMNSAQVFCWGSNDKGQSGAKSHVRL
eukprot:GHVR01170884.1.p1 GENE.GHVR01170884.1~~GHVR01170884.1.p1  ORF type:complete len:115 (+),score=3.36 GHVR01170884.1:515-859(+)